MILYVKGDLFHSPAQVLVNAVNTVGVMGKGVALQFKQLFPEMFVEYGRLCETGQLDIGKLWLYKTPNKWVLNFPTKRHWRQPAKLEYIEAGLQKFVDSYAQMQIHSIAFPPLGCGNGQLDFGSQVQPMMERFLRNLPIEVFIYPDRKSDFVEHINQDEMKRWLRNEPHSLPFSEVWEDLRVLLSQRERFVTITRGSEFTAHIIETPAAIEVTAGRQLYNIPYEALMAFWQQLRTHGFTMRHIAPGRAQHLYYVIPIFAELDYVTPVHVADRYDNLHASRVTGLQVLPSAFADRKSGEAEPEQMALL